MVDSEHEIRRCVDHLGETNDIRKAFWQMDEKVPDLIEGIRQGDDCIVVGKNVINMEGPYPMKIGMKTGLLHTCSDIVVSGGKPLYAFNAMQVDSIQQAKEASQMLKKQSNGIGVPILGGNTQMENGLAPCVSFCIFGELVSKKPIFDSSAQSGNKMIMIGGPIEGEIGDRIRTANEKFKTFQDVVRKIDVHAAKDASRGGWFGNLLEMMVKSKTGFKITSIPYPSFGRYMGNYMTCVDEEDIDKIVEIASKYGCPVTPMGEVTKKKEVVLGKKKLVNEKKMIELIRKTPFKKPKS
jgi:selenophosphate synthetase-related protein